MRSALLLVLAGLAPAQLSLPYEDEIQLVRYAQDLELRAQLFDRTAVFADLGEHVVARVDAAAARWLQRRGTVTRRIPPPGAGEELAALFARPGAPRPDPALAGVRVVLLEPAFVVVAGPPQRLARLRRAGVFGGGVVRIPLQDPYVVARGAPAPGLDATDPRIAAWVAQVQTQNLVGHVQALSSIYTRHARRPENRQAVDYLLAELGKLPALQVTVDTFSGTYGPNVIAELPGLETPDEIVMVGAHLDSLTFSGSASRAPGADDNASGSAAVLEIARVLSAAPLQRTVRFGWWNAEELGLIGSAAYAAAARARGENIVAYLNTDMNAYRAPGDTRDVDFVTNDATPSLITQLAQISQDYVPALGVKVGSLGGGSSDHASFFRNGFPAVFYFEDLDRYSPYIHTANDDTVRSTNDMTLATWITQSVTAGVAELAEPLELPVFTLDVTSGPTVGGTAVTATGGFLAAAQWVKVGGVAVPFTTSGVVRFTTPTSAVAGGVSVEIGNPAGSASAPFQYTLTQPAALRVSSPLANGQGGTGAVGGTPGYHGVTLVSLLPGPTNLGLLTVGIGGGNPAALFVHHSAALSPAGGTAQFGVQVPSNPSLAGLSVHFQAAVVDAALRSLVTTNVVTRQIQ